MIGLHSTTTTTAIPRVALRVVSNSGVRAILNRSSNFAVAVRALSSTAPSGSKHSNVEDRTGEERPIGMPWSRKLSFVRGASASDPVQPMSRKYYWIDEEAEKLIAKAYTLHLPDKPFPPSVGISTKKLEELGFLPHYVPQTFSDKVALQVVKVMEKIMHLFFRSKYDHHAVTLETVAAVPGFLAAIHRHMRSLRRMQRDHGWIDTLLEEATNERMHLLIWMQMTQPNALERLFVLAAQGTYIAAYSTLYLISPKTAHRTVGYLEEAAFRAYTDYLQAVDSGAIPNRVLTDNSIAKRFYRLPDGATLRDVILHVRADEAFHALYNHGLSTQIQEGRLDERSESPGERFQGQNKEKQERESDINMKDRGTITQR